MARKIRCYEVLAPPTSAPSTSVAAISFAGIRWFDRAAIETAVPEPLRRADCRGDRLANGGMHFRDIREPWRQARADGPDGLVGDAGISAGSRCRRAAPRPACAPHRAALPRLALVLCFADTGNGDQPGAMRRLHLGGDGGVVLAVILTSLGMAGTMTCVGAAIGDHFGGDVTGEGATFLRMAILTTGGRSRTLRAPSPRRQAVSQGGRRAGR